MGSTARSLVSSLLFFLWQKQEVRPVGGHSAPAAPGPTATLSVGAGLPSHYLAQALPAYLPVPH